MAGNEMLTVFCYDVAEDRARRRVSAILEEHMVRVQRSVFEARLSEAAAGRLAEAVARELDRCDSLRVYAIGAGSRRRCFAIGPPPMAEDQDFYLV